MRGISGKKQGHGVRGADQHPESQQGKCSPSGQQSWLKLLALLDKRNGKWEWEIESCQRLSLALSDEFIQGRPDVHFSHPWGQMQVS